MDDTLAIELYRDLAQIIAFSDASTGKQNGPVSDEAGSLVSVVAGTRKPPTVFDLRRPLDCSSVPNWQFADSLTDYGSRPNFSSVSGIKARKFGFEEGQDSEEIWLDWLRWMQAEHILLN